MITNNISFSGLTLSARKCPPNPTFDRYTSFIINLTMNNKIKITLGLFFIIIFTSCSAFRQTAYFANPPNVNCFQNEKEKNLKVSIGPFDHVESQSNIAFNKNIGMSASIYGGFKGQYGGELAGIFYSKINSKNYFETQVGCGYFKNKSIQHKLYSFGDFGEISRFEFISNYSKIFIQPTYFYTTKWVNFGFTLKLNAVYFDKYHYYFKKLAKVSDSDYTYKSYDVTIADFNDKWDIIYEPVITIQVNGIIFVQLSGIFSNNIFNSTVYYEKYGKHDNYQNILWKSEVGTDRSPQHVKFLITVGHLFLFNKK